MLKKIVGVVKNFISDDDLRGTTLYAERGSAINQLHAAQMHYATDRHRDLVKAYAFASAAASKEGERVISSQAAILKDRILAEIEPDKIVEAQNLARKYRNGIFY